jgi:hypothetical protein
MALLMVLLMSRAPLMVRIPLRRLRLHLRHLLPSNNPVYTVGKERGLFEPPFLMPDGYGSGLSPWRIFQIGMTEH